MAHQGTTVRAAGGGAGRGGRLVLLATMTALALVGCGDGDDGPGTDGPSAQSPASTAPATTGAPAPASATTVPATVRTANHATFGTILVDASGKTLYTFDRDSGGTSACTGNCAQTWPPLLLEGGASTPVAGGGVTGLGTVARPDSGTQVTAAGKPLYRYAGDSGPGDANGDGVGGVWHVAKATPAYTD